MSMPRSRVILICAAVALAAYGMSRVRGLSGAAPTPVQQSAVSYPQGDSWASIALLPDFSGAWTQPAGENLGKLVFADCCLRGPSRSAFTPKYQTLHDEVVARLERGESGHDNLVKCLPDGMPGVLMHGLALQMLYSPGGVTMLVEDGEVRRIHTDGRAHPPLDELFTSPLGHSIGHWEGSTLVVDTVGIRTDAMLFFTGGVNVTKTTHITERIYLKDKDTLRIDTTIEDPAIYTKPYSYPLEFQRGLREADFDIGCMQDNRDTESGVVDLTPPAE